MLSMSSSGRTMSVRTAVLDEFKTVVRQYGVTDDAIVMNQNKGDTHTYADVTWSSLKPSLTFET